MNLTSLYNKISETTTSIPQSNEPPPIIKSDVSQYTNILSKKSYLNESKSLIKENIPAQPSGQQPQAVASNNISSMLQNIQKKYNNSTPQEKTIITKILSSLS